MNKRRFLQTSLGLGAAAMFGMAVHGRTGVAVSEPAPGPWHERSLVALGTVLSLRLAHENAAHAERALDAAVATIHHIESQMSLFRPDSALSQLNRDGQLRQPDADLLRILQMSQDVAQRSDGAFDVTVQPLWRVFEQAQREGRLPTPAEVGQARERVGWRGLDVATDQIRLLRAGMALSLNGVAQGYAADRVRETLQRHGIEHALIDTGEWTSLGRPATGRDWTLGIASPQDESQMLARLALRGRSLATSADNQTFFSADHRHHHIFDPHTGYSPTGLSGVTVAASSCALADALTKVMFVAGYEGALKLATQWQVDVLVVDKKGRWSATPGMGLA